MSNVVSINAAPFEAPSIASAAMLVELSICAWTARKKDKGASESVTNQAGAKANTATVNKSLLSGCDELTALQKFTAHTRNAHYAMTMPWSDSGLRLLPTAQYFEYHKAMTALQNEYDKLTATFLQAYAWEVTQAQVELGNLFNYDDYPSTDTVASKFGFRMNYIPIADVSDFRVAIGQETQDALKEHYAGYYGQQLQSAMNNIWQRTFTALQHMSTKLDYTDKDKKNIFRDSLVENVLEMVDMLSICNVTQDPDMARMQRRLATALQGVTAEGLREDAGLRREVKASVDEAIKALPSLDNW
jgi:hypothetical protein